MMRILIADDHDLLRDTLVLFLDNAGGFETQTASNLEDALNLMEGSEPFDVVLLDFSMPGMNGLAGVQRALDKAQQGAVALISGLATRETAEEALEMGAAGFLPKTLTGASFVNAVKFMAMGEKYAPIAFMKEREERPEHPMVRKLTDRERQVLHGLTEGKSNKEIARDLDLTEPTIKLHMKTLYRKVGVSNRTQAALAARDAGLF